MKISVIVVTYNNRMIITQCIDSVLAQQYRDIEVIIVDNGSSDRTSDIIKERYPQVRLICNESNEGAAKARNLGVRSALGDWVLTLDADTVLDKDFLSNFVRAIEIKKGDRIGVVVPKILYPDKETIYSLGNELTFLRRFYDVGRGAKDAGRYKRLKKVFGACSAAAFYNRGMLEDIKEKGSYFDPDFFFMAEDVDLAWRARKKGWGVSLCPGSYAYHEGDSSKTPRNERSFYSIRNRFLMMFKNDSFFYFLLSFVPLAFFELLRFIFLLLKGRGGVYTAAVSSAFRISLKYNIKVDTVKSFMKNKHGKGI
ncbi:MAG: glycosyltransferase family 2 protein [Candidatus Omnitrophica bacterium]|nr:glycosyltransferase family 2 protein [Candidatus Omnitrophota bacterium]